MIIRSQVDNAVSHCTCRLSPAQVLATFKSVLDGSSPSKPVGHRAAARPASNTTCTPGGGSDAAGGVLDAGASGGSTITKPAAGGVMADDTKQQQQQQGQARGMVGSGQGQSSFMQRVAAERLEQLGRPEDIVPAGKKLEAQGGAGRGRLCFGQRSAAPRSAVCGRLRSGGEEGCNTAGQEKEEEEEESLQEGRPWGEDADIGNDRDGTDAEGADVLVLQHGDEGSVGSLTTEDPHEGTPGAQKTTAAAVGILLTAATATGKDKCIGRAAAGVATLEQFAEVIRKLAVMRYARIANATTAWQLLVEKHLLPCVERHHNR